MASLKNYTSFVLFISFNSCGHYLTELPGSEAIKLFSCSSHLSIGFQLLIKTKLQKGKAFLAFKLSDVVFIKLINVKMPTIVGILTFMSMINLMLS